MKSRHIAICTHQKLSFKLGLSPIEQLVQQRCLSSQPMYFKYFPFLFWDDGGRRRTTDEETTTADVNERRTTVLTTDRRTDGRTDDDDGQQKRRTTIFIYSYIHPFMYIHIYLYTCVYIFIYILSSFCTAAAAVAANVVFHS